MQINCTPQVTFIVDTQDFCAQLSLSEAIVVVTYLVFATVGCLAGLAVFDKMDFFGFYKVRASTDKLTQDTECVSIVLDVCCVPTCLHSITSTCVHSVSS